MKARVTVTLKSGILDPQGKAIEGALKSLGVDGVASVRQGKVFDIELSGTDKAKAEAALLPGVLMRNTRLKFICRDVFLRVERSDTPFSRGYNAGQVIRVPVAHGEGNYLADADTVARLEAEGRVLYRYVAPDGALDP